MTNLHDLVGNPPLTGELGYSAARIEGRCRFFGQHVLGSSCVE